MLWGGVHTSRAQRVQTGRLARLCMNRSYTPRGNLYCARCPLSTVKWTGLLGKERGEAEPRGARGTPASFDWAEEVSVRTEGLGFVGRL